MNSLLGTSEGSSWGTSQTQQDELPINQGMKQHEVDTEPLQLCALDMQVLDCMSRGLSQNQILTEVYGIRNPGAEYQKKLPELRAAMQRIAQQTKTSIGA